MIQATGHMQMEKWGIHVTPVTTIACDSGPGWRRVMKVVLALTALAMIALPGCGAPPIGADRALPHTVYRQATTSVLSGECSDPSKFVLHRYDLVDQYADSPGEALAYLHAQARVDSRRDVLYALAELNYRYADGLARNQEPLNSRDAPDRYLSAAVYAYLYLLGKGAEPPPSPFDMRFRVACDLYNHALARGLASPDYDDRIVLASGPRTLPAGSMAVQVTRPEFSWPVEDFDHFLPGDQYTVRGLSVRNRQSGLGAPLIAITKALGPAGRAKRVPATVFLRVDGDIDAWSKGQASASIELYSGFGHPSTTVAGQTVPLETDYTVVLAHALNQGVLWDLGSSQFFSSRELVKSDVYILSPYAPGRIPVVFVHGTFSSPVWWAEMWNTLQADSVLSQRYQIWYFVYNSGNPIVLSAARLRQSLAQKIKELDPAGKDSALQQMVVIGHSQGGLLTKMTAVEPGDRLWHSLTPVKFSDVQMDEKVRTAVADGMFFKPQPSVKRVVFISTPHRGSFLASSFVRQLAAKFMSVTREVSQFTRDVVRQREQLQLPKEFRDRAPTSLDGMSPKNPLIQALADIPLAPGVKGHSIIAVAGEGDIATGDDTVVKYSSAHIEGVASELVVRSKHSCQGKPATIEEVRRILLEHLQSIPPANSALK